MFMCQYDLSDEDSSHQADEPETHLCMAIDDLSDRDGYMADLRRVYLPRMPTHQ